MNRKATAPPAVPKPRAINPRFKDRLPAIMTEICDGLVVIEPVIDRINVQLREFLDYLDFEIKKVDLDIQRMKWEAKVDLAKMREAEAWLQEMQQLKTDFKIDMMTSPPDTIRAMLDRVSKMFRI